MCFCSAQFPYSVKVWVCRVNSDEHPSCAKCYPRSVAEQVVRIVRYNREIHKTHRQRSRSLEFTSYTTHVPIVVEPSDVQRLSQRAALSKRHLRCLARRDKLIKKPKPMLGL